MRDLDVDVVDMFSIAQHFPWAIKRNRKFSTLPTIGQKGKLFD